MKKFTFLVAALCATMMASAAVIQIDDFNSVALAATQANQTVTVQGVTLSFNGTIVDATYEGKTYRTLRVYAGKTLTVSCAEKITKIEVIGMAKKDADVTASAGTVVGGSFSADTYAYENGFDEPLFVINDVNATSTVITPVKQIRLYGIRVTTGEGGGSEGGEEGGEEGGGSEGGEGELDYSFEPTEVTTIDETMLEADWIDYTVDGLVLVWLGNEQYEVSLAVLTTEAAMPVGTFKINDSAEENTVLASPGGDETDDYPSFVAANFEGDSYHAAYYLVSGNVTISVAEDVYTIKLDAKSYNGSTIKMAYTGAVKEYTAIRTVEIDNTVYARDGRIYAEEGARIYSLTGLDVTRMNGNLEGIYIVKNGNKVAKVAVAK